MWNAELRWKVDRISTAYPDIPHFAFRM